MKRAMERPIADHREYLPPTHCKEKKKKKAYITEKYNFTLFSSFFQTFPIHLSFIAASTGNFKQQNSVSNYFVNSGNKN